MDKAMALIFHAKLWFQIIHYEYLPVYEFE